MSVQHSGGGPPQKPIPPTLSGQPTITFDQILQKVDQNGYFDSSGNLRPEIVQDWPKVIARKLKDDKLTSTQLRRFFNKAKAIEQKLKSGQDFGRLREEIQTFKPLAAAAVGKQNAPESFNQFMETNVHQAVKSQEAFIRGFVIHLQSIVAYTKYFEEKDKHTRGGR